MKKQQEKEWIEQPIYMVNGNKMMKRYKKIKIVGEGSYSKCWLVKTQNSDSIYVVKVIPKKKLELLVKQKLVYQIRIHQQLSHPNVVHLDHWFQDENYQYIFMQYCSEGNLQIRLHGLASGMPQKEIKHYVRQIVEAIIYIHSKFILHRDLKLCNFYIDAQNNIKLGDFGFACQLSHQGELKRQTCGTPNYIAPEAVSGFGYSFSSDIWAIGVILYRLKFRICPFEGKSVKETLQKVKLCNYNFPKSLKISDQLKDLIKKIFVINYDQRLNLDQIIAHSFFQIQSKKVTQRPKSESKGGFSILKSIFSKEKDSKQSSRRSSRLKEDKKEELTKRSNSCETFKQIKEIFKNKSKNTLITQQNTQLKTEESINFGARGDTLRQKSIMMTGNTMRSIAETTLGISAINRRLEGTARTNNFIIGSVKQQLKMNAKAQILQKQPPSSGTQQLGMLAKKYYLPQDIQFEKDVVVVNYKDSIKQVIYHGNGYILHRRKIPLYQMNGDIFMNPPKVLKYIIENRIQIIEGQADQEQFGQNTLQKILICVAHKWIILKDGVLLYFGKSGLFIAKMMNQQMFYIGSAVSENEGFKEDGKISIMYTREGQSYKCVQGVVLSRIYQGWVANALKQSSRKQ